MVKYVSFYTKVYTFKKKKKDQQSTYLMMLMQCFFSGFLIKVYVVGTHLNYINKLMQFKWVPTTHALISRQKVQWL